MKMKYLVFILEFVLVAGIVMAGDVEKKEVVKDESTQTVCPVMGNKINKDVYVDHEGHRVYFCCEPCIEKFKADPDKYLKSMKSQGSDQNTLRFKLTASIRLFYFEVVLSPYGCPLCDGRLKMTGQSQCSCTCGYTFDPTTVFQKSTCCQAKLIMKTFHYACSQCHKTAVSRFLFDEKVFDKKYFREMMEESRERKKKKREEKRNRG